MKHFLKLLPILLIPVLAHGQNAQKQEEKIPVPLQASVRLNSRLTGASSGTIIRAQNQKEITFITVLSTGHMRDRTVPEIEIFYLDGKKLEKPIFVTGRITLLVENNFDNGIDFSIIEAEVEAKGVAHVPLAPFDMTLKKGEKLLSIGCDLGIKPKCFDITMDYYCPDRGDFFCKGESQVGRSGGGLFTLDHKYVVGVCWGGYAHEPKSMFTSHKRIIKIMKETGVN